MTRDTGDVPAGSYDRGTRCSGDKELVLVVNLMSLDPESSPVTTQVLVKKYKN